MKSHAEYCEHNRFLELDGYRGLGVFLVIGHHMKRSVVEWANPYGAMTVFFVVSGFIITTLALREERKRGEISMKAFYVRRALRILPPYFTVLAAYCLLIFGLGIGAEKAEHLKKLLPAYVLYYQELPFFLPESFGIEYAKNVPFYQSWSLGIEEKFYLVWPVIGFVLLKRGGLSRAFAALAIGCVCAAAPSMGRLGECVFPYWNILAGCAMAVFMDDARTFGKLAVLARPVTGTCVLVAVIALHLLGAHVYEMRYLHPAIVSLALPVLLLGEGPLQRLLRTRPASFLGALSYGIYLVHLLCINVADKVFPPTSESWPAAIAAFALASAVTVFVAWLLHRTVERPCLEFARVWSKRIASRG